MKNCFSQRRIERQVKPLSNFFFALFASLRAFLFVLFLSASSVSLSQTIEDVNEYLTQLKSDTDLKNASWSFCLKEISTGKILSSHNESLSLIPASIQKLITGGVAMNVLGEDFRFVTKLEADSFTSDNHKITNYFIKGGGDPTFCSDDFPGVMFKDSVFSKWSKIVSADSGAHFILGDDTYFDNTPLSDWNWEDLGNYYGASAFGLNYHENYYTLSFNSGKFGSLVTIKNFYPNPPDMEIISFVTAGGNGDNAYIYGSPFDSYREVHGTIPANKKSFEIKGSIPDPALTIANDFSDYNGTKTGYYHQFGNYSVLLRDTIYDLRESDSARVILDSVLSPPLNSIIAHMNDNSINLYAECLLKMLGKKVKSEGSTKSGVEAIEEFFVSKNISLDGIHISDGSGLARTNLVTANFFCDALNMFTQQESFSAFYETISVGGQSGFFKNMFLGTAAEGNIRVKSGTLSRVKNYAGYIDTKSGKQLSFCFIANNFDCSSSDVKQKFETLMVKVAEME